ncbi:MAG: hypothetical protein C6H99_01230 [Epsilonproteobacteria bacterium]|nr:hypothetical protein [Campylobacterota bacterium]NPA63594.1 ComEC/Rec2 family competence protein [Campylobacterota bacterium]
MLEPAPLFLRHKERLVLLVALLLLFGVMVGLEYSRYHRLITSKRSITQAQVLNQYKKQSKWVLKLRSQEGYVFYTTSYEDLADLRARWVKVMIFPKRITFWDYLRSFYAPAVILAVHRADLRYRLYRQIVAQHENEQLGELFGALFLATPLSKEIREKIASFGVSHLVAISGFHLGLIAGLLVFVFLYLLRPLFERFVPYANLLFFASVISMVAALLYLLFLGVVPSLVRSFVMMLFGFWLFHRHMRLLSFETLGWVVLFLIALFPRFALSLAFWLSGMGVFVIYLFLRHFSSLRGWKLVVGLNFFVFWMMLPISIGIFHTFDMKMLLSPLLSLLFMVFYPLELLFHLLGIGGLADPLLGFLEWRGLGASAELPSLFLGFYFLLLLLAVRYRAALYGAALASGVVVIYYLAKL